MRKLLSCHVLMAAILLGCGSLMAQTHVGGNIAVNTTWNTAGSPYIVDSDITVAADVTLTVSPGVTVQVTQYRFIKILGTLNAQGAEAARITFTGVTETPGWWNSVYIQDAGSAILDHCDIGYGGYWENVNLFKTGSGSLSVTNSSFHHCTGNGLRITGSSGTQTLANNSFSNNNYGARIGVGMSFDDPNATFVANNRDLYADGGDITTNVVWNLPSVYSLYMAGSSTVQVGASLTVKPGTIVKMAQYSYLAVLGTLTAAGTASAPVYFTDDRDDSVGGDGNHDLDASAPSPGWWNCIHVRDAGSASLEHTTVSYGGYWENLCLWKQGTGNLSLVGSTVSRSTGNGLEIEGSTGAHTLSSSAFGNNAGAGLVLTNSQADVSDCTFSSNAYGVWQTPSNFIDYAANSFSGNSYAVGVAGGNITGDVTWGPGQGDNTFFVNGSLYLDAGSTLDLLPGTTVKFGQYNTFQVNGTLTALGTEALPIAFTGSTENPGWWNSVYVQGAGAANLDHCDIGYGGYWENVNLFKTGSGSLSVTNSSFHHCTGDGLRITGSSGAQILANNSFSNNNYGARIGVGMSFDDPNATFVANNRDVYADGGDITTNVVWNMPSVYSLYLAGSSAVQAGASLTVKAGTVVKVGQYNYLTVLGTLTAAGTASAPVYFTDLRDDSVGGDGNHDLDASTPAPGWWNCIHVLGAGTATLDYTTVSYGGYWESLCMWKEGTGDLTLTGSTVSRSSGNGLRIEGSTGAHTLGSSAFGNNAGAGLVLTNSQADVSACTFSSNAYGVWQTSSNFIDYAVNTFSGNSYAVGVAGGNITGDVTWGPGQGDNRFFVNASLYLDEGSTLDLLPGTTVKFGQYNTFQVNGTLTALGTEALPIAFTGATENPGWWNSVYVQGVGAANLDHCDIGYGGYWENVNLFKTGSGSLSATNSSFHHCTGDGLRITGSSGAQTLANNSFSHNNYGARLGVGMSFDDPAATFASNNRDVYADGGAIATSVVWNVDSDYSLYLSGSTSVQAGATLTVKPGTVVKMAQYSYLNAHGTLTAAGTAAAPVYFTDLRDDSVGGDANHNADGDAPSPGWWNCIRVLDDGAANFDHATVRYGGYWENLCLWKQGAGDLTLNNSTISFSTGNGLKIDASAGKHTLSSSSFADNANAGLVLNNSQADATGCLFARNGRAGMSQTPDVCIDYNANIFTDNANATVEIQGGNVSADVTWAPGQGTGSFLVSGNITVDAGKTLTLQPGTTVKFSQYLWLAVNGALLAQGTSASPVRFTGSTESPNWWNSIHIQNSGSAALDFCYIAYGGYWDNNNLRKDGSGDLALRNCDISHCNGNGLSLLGSSGKHEITFSSFHDNATGIYVTTAPDGLAFHNCSFTGNSSWGVYNTGLPNVDARGNWWGDASGPQNATTNPDGKGDKVSDFVLFDPWKNDQTTSHILAPMRSGEILAGDTLNFLGRQPDTGAAGYYWTLGQGRGSTLQNPGMVTFAGASVDTEVTTTFAVVDAKGVVDPYPDSRLFTVKTNPGNIPDLKVTTFNVPANLQVGDVYSLTYTATNIGKGPITNKSWRDAVYLSRDVYLDDSDTLLSAAELPAQTLAIGASYNGALTTYIPAVKEGDSYLILSLDDSWKVLEEHQLNNERAASSNLGVATVANGETVKGAFTLVSTPKYYKLKVTEGQSLDFTFSGNVIVYLRFGAFPGLGQYDYRMTLGEGGRLTIPGLTPGDWYIMVVPDPAVGATDFEFKPTLADFLLTAVSPKQCSNATEIVLTLSGAGFAKGAAAELESSTGTVIPATSTEVYSFAKANATFAAGTVPAGVGYLVRITQPGKTDAELADALTVVAEGKAELAINLVLPERMGYHQLATIYVEYTNKGDIPMPAPLLFLTAIQNGRQGALMTLDRTKISQGFWTSAVPQGFSHTINILASGSVAGLLQAGETRRIPVYYAGWQQPWDFAYPPFEFKVGAITTETTTPIQWEALKSALMPPFLTTEAWDAIFPNLVAQIGPTWGDFVSMLSRNASYLNQVGRSTNDARTLLGFEYLLANAAGPERNLCSDVDALLDAPGIPLGFGRVYPTLLSLRKASGIFGKGWLSTWDSSLTSSSDGTVVILSAGCRRTFQPDSRGGYFAEPGDYATLAKTADGWTLRENTGSLYTFGADRSLSSIEDLNGNKITVAYSGGKPVTLTHSCGVALTIAYNAAGHVQSVTDSTGRATTYAYDSSGELLASVTLFDGQTTSYTYNSSGSNAALDALASTTYPDGTGELFGYDAAGRLSSVAEKGGGSIAYAYSGAKAVGTDADGNTFTAFLDDRGWLASLNDPLGVIDNLTLTDNSNLLGVNDTNGTNYHYSYDATGDLASNLDPLGAASGFAYGNTYSRIVSATDQLGNKTEYSSDAKANLTAIKDAVGKLRAFTYSSAGNLLSDTNRRGQKTNYEYDANGRLTKTIAPDASETPRVYDANGNLSSFTDAFGTTTLVYDSKQRLEKITYPGGLFLQYEYDDAGRRTKMTTQTGHAVNYSYNARGLLAKTTDETDALIAQFTYDTTGRITRKDLGNATYVLYKYNANNRLAEVTNHNAAAAALSQFVYHFDAFDRISKLETPEGDWTYTYDGSGQLLTAVFASDNPAALPNQSLSYTYDLAGNRTKANVDYTVNSLNQYTAAGAERFAYDADGNLTRKTGTKEWAYAYDPAGRLIQAGDGTDTSVFAYNGLGQRVSVSVNGVMRRYVFDPVGFGEIVGEYDGANTLLANYDHAIELASKTEAGGGRYFYHFDASGNATELTDASGAVANAYRFLPFGENQKASETVGNPFKFCGSDASPTDACGLVHMRARHYDPALGRFVQPDPVGIAAGMNLYAYVGNDPMEYTDPSGLITGNLSQFPVPGVDPRGGAGLEWVQNQFTQEALHSSKTYTGCRRFANDGVKQIATKGRFVNGRMVADSEKAWKLARDARFSAAVKARRIEEAAAAARNTATAAKTATTGATTGAAQAGKYTLGGLVVIATTIWTGGAVVVSGVGWLTGSDEVSDAGSAMFDALSPSGWEVAWDYYFGDSESVASQDPNQKVGPGGYGPNHYISPNAPFVYRVDFENTPSATAPAQVVAVIDQLNANLDWNSLEFTEFGFGDQVIPVPGNTLEYAGSQDMVDSGKELQVQLSGSVDSSGKISVLFSSVDPATGLPPEVDYGFLPPEDGTGRGKGHFCFTIKPKSGLATGVEIRNIADITFDFSKTIATNQTSAEDPTPDPAKECLVTIDATLPVSAVTALPAKSPVEFIVKWSGTDAEAGIQSYSVYVQDNGGAFTPWLLGTTETSSVFTGLSGHSYGFYALAIDNVGNTETAKTKADTTTLADAATKTLAVVSTAAITPYGSERKSGGDVVIDGGDPVTARGVCWSIFHNPDVAGTYKSFDGAGKGEFESLIRELQPNNTYYVRAYATNGVGTAYGEELSFQTSPTDKVILTAKASPTSGGTVTPSAQLEVDSNVATPITATAASGYVFVGWSLGGGDATLAAPASANTTATLRQNATATAHFINELLPPPMPKFTVQLDNSAAAKDSVSITKATLPSLPDGYNPASDQVSVFIDDYEFVIDPTTWKANSKGTMFTAKSPKSTAPLATTLTFDLTKKVWTFKASKATINAQVDNSDGVFIFLKANGQYSGALFAMKESTKWTAPGEELRLVGLGGTPMSNFSLVGSKVKGSYTSYTVNKDSFSVEKGILALPGAFVPDAAASLQVHNLTLALGPYTKKGSKETYSYNSAKGATPTVNSSIDFDKGLWTVKMSKGDCAQIGDRNEGVDIILTLGEYRDGVKVKLYKKTKLTYSP